MNEDNGIDAIKARTFLADYYGTEFTAFASAAFADVALIGEGAWSRCFGYRYCDADLVIRFGNFVEDFQKDQLAYRYASPDLPVPEVLDIGQAFDGYYAISTRVHGIPLESVNADQWLALLPKVVAALEAMRTADLSSTTGIGGWGADRHASSISWSADLLQVAEDAPAQRGHGWRKKLAESPEGDSTFDWGYALLERFISDSVPRSLIHGDLINRNVLVAGDLISGFFDWGCSRYGDHLYDLAWFEFWSPWYPELDMQLLRAALAEHWQKVGYVPNDVETRLMVCYLHIGLEHLAYNASIDDEINLLATVERMRILIGDS